MKLFKSAVFFLWLSAPVFAADPKLDSEIAHQAQFGRAGDIPLLVKQGADPNGVNESGMPAIVAAAVRQDEYGVGIIDALLTAGADINAQDTEGQTALHHAAATGNMEIVKFLMEKGANSYVQDKYGNYAAGMAFQKDYKDVYAYINEFVEKQRQQRLKEYKDYNDSIKEQYKVVQERLNQYNNQQTVKTQDAIEQYEQDLKTKKELEDAIERKKQEQQQARDKFRQVKESYASEAFKNDIQALSTQACNFQYWSYCKKVRVKTDFSAEQLDEAISKESGSIRNTRAALKEKYLLKDNYLDKIIASAQKKIFRELKEYGSNATLASNGVGTKEDARQRCHEAAGSLDFDGITYYEEEVPQKPAYGPASPLPQTIQPTAPAPGTGAPVRPQQIHRNKMP